MSGLRPTCDTCGYVLPKHHPECPADTTRSPTSPRSSRSGRRGRHPIWVLLDKLQMDNREQAAKLVELRALVAGLELPDPSASLCPECGTRFRSRLVMEEHRYQNHEGPVPEHYVRAERLAGFVCDVDESAGVAEQVQP